MEYFRVQRPSMLRDDVETFIFKSNFHNVDFKYFDELWINNKDGYLAWMIIE